MAAIVTKNFNISNAEEVITSISTDNYYLFIAKATSWADDGSPPTPEDTVQQTDYTHWEDMIAAKQITASDVVPAVPRIDWSSGTIYSKYDPNDAGLFGKNFYVMTSSYRVYKCIDRPAATASTFEPTHETSAIGPDNGDGYRWKFMYKITAPQAVKFLNPSFIPVYENSGNEDTGNSVGLLPYPYGGHGANNKKELGAFYVNINVRLAFDESNTFTTKNDYRKIGIVKNPFLFGTTTPATAASYRQTARLTVTGTGGSFLADEIVYNNADSNIQATVIEWGETNNYLYINIDKDAPAGAFSSGSVDGQTSSESRTISAIDDPGLERYTGDVLYLENRPPINRDVEQTESISIVLQF